MVTKLIKLSTWAKINGYSYRGAYNRFKSGNLQQAFINETGRIVVPEAIPEQPIKTIIYARVSSPKQKNDLDIQAKRLEGFCLAKGWLIHSVVKEVASGLNDKRPKLISILKLKDPIRLVVEHKDRLTRFGFNYLETLLNGQIVVVNLAESDKEDLIQDLISVITSMVARYYGQRRCSRKITLIKNILEDDAEEKTN